MVTAMCTAYVTPGHRQARTHQRGRLLRYGTAGEDVAHGTEARKRWRYLHDAIYPVILNEASSFHHPLPLLGNHALVVLGDLQNL